MSSKRRIIRLEEQGLLLERRMFEVRSRYLMLYITLNYMPEYRDDISIDDFLEHRDKFLNNFESNKLLKGIKAYIWKIEEGEKSGLHIHFLIFYSAEFRADVSLAKCIGEYWVDVVTHGMGAYWNSNAEKEKFERQGLWGLGQANRKDDERRAGVRRIIRYLAKSDQAVSGLPPHGRRFGMSQLP